MSDPFNRAPGSGKRENPNERLVSLWEAALRIVRWENRVDEFKALNAPLVLIRDYEKKVRLAREKMPSEAERFLEPAREYEKKIIKQREFVEKSLIGVSIRELEEYEVEHVPPTAEEELELEEDLGSESSNLPKGNSPEDFSEYDMDLLKKFLVRLREKKESKEYISVVQELLRVFRSISFEIRLAGFSPEDDIEEREQKIENMQIFQFLISALEELQVILHADPIKRKEEDFVKRLLENIDRSPKELVPVLLLLCDEIVEDLKTSKFPPPPKEPDEIKTARKNLLRGKDAIN